MAIVGIDGFFKHKGTTILEGYEFKDLRNLYNYFKEYSLEKYRISIRGGSLVFRNNSQKFYLLLSSFCIAVTTYSGFGLFYFLFREKSTGASILISIFFIVFLFGAVKSLFSFFHGDFRINYLNREINGHFIFSGESYLLGVSIDQFEKVTIYLSNSEETFQLNQFTDQKEKSNFKDIGICLFFTKFVLERYFNLDIELDVLAKKQLEKYLKNNITLDKILLP